jgi:signal transduction histidine kinase
MTVMALAGGGAILLSTQFLAQPFVWRNWTLDVVLVGWLHVAADRLLVAAPIAVAVWFSMRLPARRSGPRIALTALAVVVGAVLGELLRLELDPFADRPDAPAILGRILNWILVSAAGTGIIALWRRGGDLATIAAETGAADARARRMLLASELEGLQRQIEPHFLFNTLATIKSLGRTAPKDADTLLERLFDYLSRSFAVSSVRSSTLGAELDLVTAYLDVCATRMGPRLTIIDSIDPSLRACDLPPLMLGTLVENAVRHGLAPLPRGGTIRLSAQVIGGDLELCVADDGIGLAAEGGAGIGLANLAARLRLLHGGRASLRLEPRSGGGVLAILRLPYAATADARAA